MTLLINFKNKKMKTFKSTKGGVNPISVTVFIILIGTSIGLFSLELINMSLFISFLVISLFLANTIHIADQWEKAVVLRMGKYRGLKGPGIFFIIPIIDNIDNYIDQ